MTLAPATRLGPYEIQAPLGAGGMGEVYRARDTRLEREVAVKVLPSSTSADPVARARLLREARLASKLNHPNVCTIHEVGEAGGTAFIAMELVDGMSLAERLAGGGLSLEEALRIGAQMTEALAHAHERGIVHRDLKSSNVFITPEGRVKVLDFGLAKRLASEDVAEAATLTQGALTKTGTLTGTLAYMAPEQLRGQPADARSDLWALGVVLFEMVAGHPPFQEALSSALIDDIIHKETPLPSRVRPHVPPELERIILKCLEKEPEKRYSSARELLIVLRRLVPQGAGFPAPRRAAFFRRPSAVVLVAALAILAAGATGFLVWKRRVSPAAPGGRVMLAVLPVENLSGGPEQDYFSDGLTEELISQLGRLQPKRLGVIARTSAMRYKRTQKPLDQIGRELGVDYVLESSLRREADRVRITAQLIEVRDQTHLWAESYERPLTGILAIQSEVSERVARSLAVELLPSDQARSGEARPVNAEAHDLYLRGRHHWNRRTPRELLEATREFEAATGLDPTYSVAWAGLADSYALYAHYGVLSPHEAFPHARAAAQKALALDPALVEAETALAFVTLYYNWDWAGAESQLQGILDRRPDYAIARQWFAEYLSAMGRHDAALREIHRAGESDPLSPIISSMEGYVLFYAHRFEESLKACRRVHSLEPEFALAYAIEGHAYAATGRNQEALDAYLVADRLSGGDSVFQAEIAVVTIRLGRREEARRILERITSPGWKGRRARPVGVAIVHRALGEADQAMRWLEKAYEERDVQLVRIRVDPRFDPMRSDPRFEGLLRRMKLPPP